jgi:hypothetical protein
MAKQFDARSVTLIPNCRGGWTLHSDGILDDQDYNELELEKEIERLLAEGWSLVGNVSHKTSLGTLSQRVLYFRREISESEP